MLCKHSLLKNTPLFWKQMKKDFSFSIILMITRIDNTDRGGMMSIFLYVWHFITNKIMNIRIFYFEKLKTFPKVHFWWKTEKDRMSITRLSKFNNIWQIWQLQHMSKTCQRVFNSIKLLRRYDEFEKILIRVQRDM